MRFRLTTLALLATAAAGHAAAGALADDPAALGRGAEDYARFCASCHGAALEGQPEWQVQKPDGTYPAPPHDTSGHTWHHSDRLLFRYVKLGGQEVLKGIPGLKSAMPGFAGLLADDEIRDVLAFIRSHWPDRERAYQEAVTANDN